MSYEDFKNYRKKFEQDEDINELEERGQCDWCFYCKELIGESEPFVVDGEDVYHVDCFDLLRNVDEIEEEEE